MSPSLFLSLPLLLSIASAQICDNYGFLNGSTCACPVGFGGSSCSQPACGGTIFQGSQRPLASVSTGSFVNLTSCQVGWTGLGCNVCQTANACLAAYSSVASSSSILDGQNDTMACSTIPHVYASSQMSCKANPTLQALYPLDSYLNIMRTVQPSLTPLPNITSFGGAGTAYVQLFYAGVEQFYCEADSCVQEAVNQPQGGISWTCSNLQCTCRFGTSFCGGVPSTNLTDTIDKLGGRLEIDCQGVDNSAQTATCNFKQTMLGQLFGPGGLALQGCTFGECVRKSIASGSTAGNSLSRGSIAGLVVAGALVLRVLL